MTSAAESYAYHAENRADGKPLVFVFHGTGGTETQFVPLARELMPGAAIIAPRGDVSEHGALRHLVEIANVDVRPTADLAASSDLTQVFESTQAREPRRAH